MSKKLSTLIMNGHSVKMWWIFLCYLVYIFSLVSELAWSRWNEPTISFVNLNKTTINSQNCLLKVFFSSLLLYNKIAAPYIATTRFTKLYYDKWHQIILITLIIKDSSNIHSLLYFLKEYNGHEEFLLFTMIIGGLFEI